MKKARHREITVENHEVVIVRRARKSMKRWCPGCVAVVEMFTPEEAAAVCGLPVREIYRRVETGTIHSYESEKGLLWVCVNTGPVSGKALAAGPKQKPSRR